MARVWVIEWAMAMEAILQVVTGLGMKRQNGFG